MKLIGSNPSPYVRRIRMLLMDVQYEFVSIDMFTKEGRELLNSYGPIARIPILENGSDVIWDSIEIVKYLSSKNVINLKPEHIDSQKLIAINEMTDSGIVLFQMKKFNLDPDWKNLFSQNHLQRIMNILSYLEDNFNFLKNNWKLEAKWLFCTLDWFEFRSVVNWKDKFKLLANFHEEHQDKIEVIKTRPLV